MKPDLTIKHRKGSPKLSKSIVSKDMNSYNIRTNNKNTKHLVLETANSLRFKPNQRLKRPVEKKSFTIGVVIPENSHSFFHEVIRGIEEIIDQTEYQIILEPTSESEECEKEVIEMLQTKSVDGILVSTCQSMEGGLLFEKLLKSGIALVFFDRCIDELEVSSVSVNDSTSSQYITEHLIDLGYKKIAYLSGSREVSIGRDRYKGYRKALLNNDLIMYEELVIESGFQEEGGFLAMSKILKLPSKDWPDAVVAVNDPVAFGAIKAINQKGLKIPNDIAIVGFSDDIQSNLLDVPLTTVKQPAYEVGKKAADKLIRLIENENELHEKISIVTGLKIRSSCGFNLKHNQSEI